MFAALTLTVSLVALAAAVKLLVKTVKDLEACEKNRK